MDNNIRHFTYFCLYLELTCWIFFKAKYYEYNCREIMHMLFTTLFLNILQLLWQPKRKENTRITALHVHFIIWQKVNKSVMLIYCWVFNNFFSTFSGLITGNEHLKHQYFLGRYIPLFCQNYTADRKLYSNINTYLPLYVFIEMLPMITEIAEACSVIM